MRGRAVQPKSSVPALELAWGRLRLKAEGTLAMIALMVCTTLISFNIPDLASRVWELVKQAAH